MRIPRLNAHPTWTTRGRAVLALLMLGMLAIIASAGCSGPTIPIPPTPTPDPSAVRVAQSHQHGSGGLEGRLATKYGGPIKVGLAARPDNPTPREPFAVTYTLQDQAGAPVTPGSLLVTHERLMHMFVVSQDLRHFSHIHPEAGDAGRYSASDTLPFDGKYILFNTFVAADGTTQIERHVLASSGAANSGSGSDPGPVAGVDTPAVLASDLAVPQEVGGLTVVMRSDVQKVRRRAPVSFTISVSKVGAPVTNMEPYLGAAFHVVIISSDTRQFTHTHGDVLGGPMAGDMSAMNMSGLNSMNMPTPPPSFGPDLQFTHTFMQPGMYRVWLQFAHQGKVFTVANNVQVVK